MTSPRNCGTIVFTQCCLPTSQALAQVCHKSYSIYLKYKWRWEQYGAFWIPKATCICWNSQSAINLLGTHPWSRAAGEQRIDDGLIEVIGLTTYQLPMLQVIDKICTSCFCTSLVWYKYMPCCTLFYFNYVLLMVLHANIHIILRLLWYMQ